MLLPFSDGYDIPSKMKRLFKLESGFNSIDLARVVNDVSRFRISQFEYTATGSSTETVHVCLDGSQNFDETSGLYYSLFFVCHGSQSVTYTPATTTEGWFNAHAFHSTNINIFIDSVVAGDISSQNCYIELQFE